MSQSQGNEFLQSFLRDRDARCPACNYSLRNCASNQCPECGAALELGLIGPPGKGQLWWAMAMAGSFIAAGIASIMLIVVLEDLAGIVEDVSRVQLIAGGFAPQSLAPEGKPILLMTVMALATITAFIWLIAARRRFTAWSPRKQQAVGITAALSPFVLLGVIYLMIRFVL